MFQIPLLVGGALVLCQSIGCHSSCGRDSEVDIWALVLDGQRHLEMPDINRIIKYLRKWGIWSRVSCKVSRSSIVMPSSLWLNMISWQSAMRYSITVSLSFEVYNWRMIVVEDTSWVPYFLIPQFALSVGSTPVKYTPSLKISSIKPRQ